MFYYMIRYLLVLSFAFFLPGRAETHVSEQLSNRQTRPVPILWTVDASPDGRYFAVGGNDGFLRIFNAETSALIKEYQLNHAVQCLDWHKDGQELAIGLDAVSARILNVASGKFRELKQVSGSRALDWNYDGTLLAIGDYDNALLIFDQELNLISSIKTPDNKTYLSIEWHPSKNIILTGTDKIRIFDLTGRILHSVKHRTEETPILAVRWHPDGSLFATGDYGEPENNIESILQLWSEDGKLMKTLLGSKAEYRNIRWDKNGEFLATASDALRIRTRSGQVVHTGKSDDLLWGLEWSTDNSKIIATSAKGKISVWTKKARLLKVYQ